MSDGDGAIVNLPLHKRGAGSLDAQIDSFKRRLRSGERADRKAQAAETRKNRSLAKALFEAHGKSLAYRIADRGGMSRREALQQLRRVCHWTPLVAISALRDEEARESAP